MRTPRIKEDGAGYYHVISRVVDRRRVFDRDEKERFRATMRAVEAFSGCELLTWSCLDNHFHLLLSVPERQPVTDEELIARLGHLYGRQEVKSLDAYLYVTGEARGQSETGRPTQPGFQPEKVEEVIQAGGTLPLNQVLRCRVRYFSDGAVLGSRTFVEDVFTRHRHRFSPKRRRAAHGMVGGAWGELCTFRRLRLQPIAPPCITD